MHYSCTIFYVNYTTIKAYRLELIFSKFQYIIQLIRNLLQLSNKVYLDKNNFRFSNLNIKLII